MAGTPRARLSAFAADALNVVCEELGDAQSRLIQSNVISS